MKFDMELFKKTRCDQYLKVVSSGEGIQMFVGDTLIQEMKVIYQPALYLNQEEAQSLIDMLKTVIYHQDKLPEKR